jgi:hypothetical protein
MELRDLHTSDPIKNKEIKLEALTDNVSFSILSYPILPIQRTERQRQTGREPPSEVTMADWIVTSHRRNPFRFLREIREGGRFGGKEGFGMRRRAAWSMVMVMVMV